MFFKNVLKGAHFTLVFSASNTYRQAEHTSIKTVTTIILLQTVSREVAPCLLGCLYKSLHESAPGGMYHKNTNNLLWKNAFFETDYL